MCKDTKIVVKLQTFRRKFFFALRFSSCALHHPKWEIEQKEHPCYSITRMLSDKSAYAKGKMDVVDAKVIIIGEIDTVNSLIYFT